MLEIIEYAEKDQERWNNFVEGSRNGTFMINRNFMDYHSNRFDDYSLLLCKDGQLIAVMPANISENTLYSHKGLTYGGFIYDTRMTVSVMLDTFETLFTHLKSINVSKVIYKAIPYFYHTYPAEEDLYALFRCGAKLTRRDVSTTIYLPDRLKFKERRRRGISKATRNSIVIKQTNDYDSYMSIVSDILSKKYNKNPTHTNDEIKLLAGRFPENIKLFAGYKEEKMLGGIITFEWKHAVHSQYIAAGDEGKEQGVLDLLFDHLITTQFKDKIYFDFGISTEQEGKYLNTGLITQKEEFGGRATVYDTYEINI